VEAKNASTGTGASRIVASVFGVLAGLGGITHGIGEVLQGNVAPSGIIIESWTQGPIAAYMGGEPGMTVVPNLLITGVLGIVVSAAVVVWAAGFVQRRHGGWILLLLAVGMMLFGGGFGPPIIGILAGVAGTRIAAPLTWWRTRLPVNLRRFLATLWPWLFAVAAINGLVLFVGSVVLVYTISFNNPDLFVGSFFFAVLSLPPTIVTGIAYDLETRERGRGV